MHQTKIDDEIIGLLFVETLNSLNKAYKMARMYGKIVYDNGSPLIRHITIELEHCEVYFWIAHGQVFRYRVINYK